MKYIVLEIQTNKNGTVGNIVTSYDDMSLAESKYHQILAAAATSSVPIHTAVMLTNDGAVIKSEHYMHNSEE